MGERGWAVRWLDRGGNLTVMPFGDGLRAAAAEFDGRLEDGDIRGLSLYWDRGDTQPRLNHGPGRCPIYEAASDRDGGSYNDGPVSGDLDRLACRVEDRMDEEVWG